MNNGKKNFQTNRSEIEHMLIQQRDTTPARYLLPTPTPPQAFYIYDDIGDSKDYIDLIYALDTAQEGEVITLRFDTGGGSLFTTIAIIHAMHRTQGTVVGFADGLVASAGTILLLNCHEMYFGEYAQLMFHDGSGAGGDGKFSESKASIDAVTKLYARIAREAYGPFFSEDEINRMLNGQDFWIDSEEMVARMDRYAASQEALEAEEEPEALEPQLLQE